MIDTHCHINLLVKQTFDTRLLPQEINAAQDIINAADAHGVNTIINVGTSSPENKNCIALAQAYPTVFATIGLHPNDAKNDWQQIVREMHCMLENKTTNKIVGVGECGMDKHYPDYNLARQQDVFKAQIELALHHDVPLVIHSRDAADETLTILQEYVPNFKDRLPAGTMHCFSYDQAIADTVISWGFFLGIGGTITYPKNDVLRHVVQRVGLEHIVLETDAPFLPPQIIRGQRNHPKYIATIAEYLAHMLDTSTENVATITTKNSRALFRI